MDLTVDQLTAGLSRADLIEGAWEIEGEIVGLRLPSNDQELEQAVDWLVGSTELTAQATLTGLAALASIGQHDDVMERALSSPGRHANVDRPPGLVIARTPQSAQADPPPGDKTGHGRVG